MPVLESFIDAYRRREKGIRDEEMGQLQQVGVLAGLQAKMQAAQKAAAYEKAMSGLPPDATEEQQLQAARPFQSADQLGQQIGSSRDRREATAQRAQQFIMQIDAKQQDLDRRRDEFNQRTTDTAARAAFEQWYKTESLKNSQQQNAALNAMRQQGIDIQQMGLDLRRDMLAPKGTGIADIGIAPAAQVGATAIPPGVQGAAATGGSGFFGGIANTAADMIGMRMPLPEVEQASQALKNLKIQTITMAQDAVPGRPSNYLMQQLEKLAVEPGSLFMADQRAHVRLQQTRDMLQQEVSRMQREILERPQQFTTAVLAKTRNSFGQLRQLIGEYDRVITSFGASGPTVSGQIGRPETLPPPPGFKRD